MQYLNRILIGLSLILFLACETAVREKPINEYYDVDALIDRQSKLLTESATPKLRNQ